MKTSQVQTKGYIGVRGNSELDTVELAHIVSYLGDEFGSLVCRLRSVGEELTDRIGEAIHPLNN